MWSCNSQKSRTQDENAMIWVQRSFYSQISDPKWGGMLAAPCSDAASLALCRDWNRIKMSSALLSESTKRETNVVEENVETPCTGKRSLIVFAGSGLLSDPFRVRGGAAAFGARGEMQEAQTFKFARFPFPQIHHFGGGRTCKLHTENTLAHLHPPD